MRTAERNTSFGDHRPYSAVGFGVPPLLDVPSDEWEPYWTLHLRSAPAALRKEEAHHLAGRVGASRIGVRPDWASPVPRVLAAMNRPGFSDDDVVDVAVHSACARMAGGPLVDMRRV